MQKKKEKRKKITKCLYSITLVSTVASIFIFTYLAVFRNEYNIDRSYNIEPDLAAKYGDFIGGIFGPIFAIIGIFLVVCTLLNQSQVNAENTLSNHKNTVAGLFFKMIDYHNGNIDKLKVGHVYDDKNNVIENRRAFVIFKIQLIELIKIVKKINSELALNLDKKHIADIAYTVFYYGIEHEWADYTRTKLSMYNESDKIYTMLLQEIDKSNNAVGRTNQTSLSAYFRNMYHAIKLVDNDEYLTDDEKKQYVKILRAQLSNPELIILYFNLISRFGKKWKEKKYVEKYGFLTNLSIDECKRYGFDPNQDFPIDYEETEYNS